MKKFEDLLNKRDSELEKERNERELRIREYNAKKQAAILRFVLSLLGVLVGYYLGVVKWDGGLFTGLFMQLLLLVSGVAAVVLLVQLFILLAKNVE